jgi:hypothetical protein
LFLISLWRVGFQKVILHLLFDQETALNMVECKKMSLESYSQEAHRLLASFLSSQLDAPGHWYAPMLPDDHPSSFCKLTGLSSGELCLVLEAAGFVVKQGKNNNSYSFHSDTFNGFLQSPQLQLIDKSVSQPSILKRKRHWAYLIGSKD